mmetsp:Transcript_8874/g.25564  ORF Transcript_8874/g.25564 Transcript_8874/m.25564 type:complete len:1086 (+) Transcript_8874:110-3367(+)
MQAHDCAGIDDPCCLGELAHSDGSGGTKHHRFTTPSWMRSCLSEVRIQSAIAATTAQVVQNNFNDMYAFTHLVENSTNAAAELPVAAAVVHPVAVDVAGMVQSALQSSKMAEDGLYHSAYAFHYGMASALRSLNDPNTAYVTPFGDWTLLRAVDVVPNSSMDGTVEYLLQAAPGWMEGTLAEGVLSPELYESIHGVAAADAKPFMGYAVTAVNGVPVEEHLQQRADALGEARSPANRLAYLVGAHRPALGAESLASVPPPGVDEEVFSFSGGVTQTWKLTVRYSGAAQGRQDLEDSYNDNTAYTSLHGAFAAVEEAYTELWGEPCQGCYPSSAARTAPAGGNSASLAERFQALAASAEEMATILAGMAGSQLASEGEGCAASGCSDLTIGARVGEVDGEHLYCDYGDCDYSNEEYHYEDFVNMEAESVAEDIELVAQFHAGVPFSASAPFLGVYQANSAMILKINSFQPVGGVFGPRLGRQAAQRGAEAPLLGALRAAMAVAAERAKQHGVKWLLLDVSSAVGGGSGSAGGDGLSDSAALFLLKLLLPDWSAASLLCDTSAVRVSALTDFLADASESSTAALRAAVAAAPSGDDLLRVGTAILQMSNALGHLLQGLPGGNRVITAAAADVIASVPAVQAQLEDLGIPDDSRRALISSFVQDKVGALSTAAVQQALAAGGVPFDPISGKPFNSTSWYFANRKESTDSYTQRFHTAACMEALEAEASSRATHEFQTLVILTDGACGGACSTLTARLALSGAVRTVSHGTEPRLQGGLLDLSPTGRGSQQRWNERSLATIYAYLMHLLLGVQPEAAGQVDFTHLPVPLPSTVEVRFGTDAVFEPYLGEQALPREFYNLAADVHIPLQAALPGTLPAPGGLVSSGITRVWDFCFTQFSLAPLLSQWRPPQGTGGNGSGSVDDDDDGGGSKDETVVAVSAVIVFREMLIVDVTQVVRDLVRDQLARQAGLSPDRVVVLSTVPGSVVWNVSALFPAAATDQIEQYENAITTDLVAVFSEELLLVRFEPEHIAAAVDRTEASSLEAYLATALDGGDGSSTSRGYMATSHSWRGSMLRQQLLLCVLTLAVLMR